MARKPRSRIGNPRLDFVEHLARFWDTHDLTDHETELEEVEEPVFGPKAQTVVRIRLKPKQAQALRRRAKAAGVPQAELVEGWIAEKLNCR